MTHTHTHLIHSQRHTWTSPEIDQPLVGPSCPLGWVQLPEIRLSRAPPNVGVSLIKQVCLNWAELQSDDDWRPEWTHIVLPLWDFLSVLHVFDLLRRTFVMLSFFTCCCLIRVDFRGNACLCDRVGVMVPESTRVNVFDAAACSVGQRITSGSAAGIFTVATVCVSALSPRICSNMQCLCWS